MSKVVSQFTLKEGSTLEVGERIECYYNLTEGGFSIVALDKRNPNKGRVVAYSPFVQMENAQFCLNANKLEKILSNNRKTVYAVVRGIYAGCENIDDSTYIKGYCNPFKTASFVNYETGEKLETASKVHFYEKFFSFKY